MWVLYFYFLFQQILAKDFMVVPAEVVSLPAPYRGSVLVEQPKVVRVKVAGGSVNIIALKPGVSAVTVGDERHLIQVLSPADMQLFKKLKERTKMMLGPEVVVVDGEIKIRGEILRLSDLQIMADLARASGRFKLEASLPTSVLQQTQEYLRQLQTRQGLAPITIQFGDEAIAALPQNHKDLLASYNKALTPFGIRVELDSKGIELEPLVRVRILVAEVRKSAMRKIGVDWPTSIKATLLPNGNLETPNPEWTVQALEAKVTSSLRRLFYAAVMKKPSS